MLPGAGCRIMTDPEQFPIEKQSVNAEEPPELIFFDVDDVSEEAEFIRVDDLFRQEGEAIEKLSGLVWFTIFPRQSGQYLSAALSRILRRTLILSGIRMEKPAEKIRIRPVFAQWQIDLKETDDPEKLMREFKTDLETQAGILLGYDEDKRFWADSCFICPENDRITDEMISRLAVRYQEPPSGEDL